MIRVIRRKPEVGGGNLIDFAELRVGDLIEKSRRNQKNR
jgi:hypothetical protein